MGELDGKTVLVTGAARGLGAAIARRCVGQGAVVILCDILQDELTVTGDELGPTARTFHLDVTRAESWDDVARVVRADHGRLDVLVNNAGILLPGSLEDQSIDDFRRTLDVNLVGVVLGMKTFVALHRAGAGDRGSIVNMSSVRGIVGGTNISAYCATKFGVRGLTKAAAIEFGPLGIRVNSVCPGPIVTDMSMGDSLAHLDWDHYAQQLPVRRLGHPDDVAAAVCWLAADASAFVTGTELVVDGGLTALGISAQPRSQTAV
jgi:3alpha(or 20beta)-hydroxysteroid dehydrogenase